MNALLFGSGGALGTSIYETLSKQKYSIFTSGSARGIDSSSHIQISYKDSLGPNLFESLPTLDSVIWAQGLNHSDSINEFELEDLNKLWNSNVVFITSTLSALLKAGKLTSGSRLCLVSSIMQLESRTGKLSYTISKSALHGLVKSCAIDLGPKGILINAVLPGVVDTPMTRQHLSAKQISSISEKSALRRLALPEDIASAVAFLVGPLNSSITGQFLTIDCGFIGLSHF